MKSSYLQYLNLPMKMNPICYYHNPCADGWWAAYAVWKQYPDAEFVGATHGRKFDISNCADRDVIIVDFTFGIEQTNELCELARTVTVLDHHKSAMGAFEEIKLPNLTTVFDMSRSGAQIAWEFFHDTPVPEVINYVADRDLWRNVLPHTKVVNAGLHFTINELDFAKMSRIINTNAIDQMKLIGESVTMVQNREVEIAVKYHSLCNWTVGEKTYRVRISNGKRQLRSDIGNELVKLGDCDFAVVWTYKFPQNEFWLSLRSCDEMTDVSQVADQFCDRQGRPGGGHRNAAGCVLWSDVGMNLADYFVPMQGM